MGAGAPSAPAKRKSLGQHFLRDDRIVRRILDAATLQPGHRVLEIGPGAGAMTLPLCEAVGPKGSVVAIEADARFAEMLQHDAPANLAVHHADAMQVDLAAWGPYDRIVANLPYQISGPITVRLLELMQAGIVGPAILMFQKEFANRLLAGPGSKTYGRLSVHLAPVATIRKVRDVSPGSFDPPPKVHSTVVRLDPHDTPPFVVADEALWRAVVDGAFQQRRKQLKNTVPASVASLGITEEAARSALGDLDLVQLRPEQVAPETFAALVAALARSA